MKEIKVVLVGFGYWGRNAAKALHSLGCLAGIAELNPENLAEARKAYPDLDCRSQFEDFLTDLKVTAFYLATPAPTHAELACRAMESGKDVLVEKPMCLNSAEAEKITALSRATGRILMTGHLLLYHPAVLKLKAMIDQGELGKILYIYSNRLNFGKIRTEENSMWSFAPHDISVMNFLLGETPNEVSAFGSDHLTQGVQDTTMTYLEYRSVKGHIFVSWLHPYKEQRLVVVGEKKMVIFSDTEKDKLVAYDHEVSWEDRQPVVRKGDAKSILFEAAEPLKNQCAAFVAAIRSRQNPLADGENGLQVVRVLEASDRSIKDGGKKITLRKSADKAYFCHETACVDAGAEIGEGTKIWHFSHVLPGARIGRNCTVGQNVNIDSKAVIGNSVKIQNNVSIYSGVVIEDEVFLGPSCVLTNVKNPRSEINRHSLYEKTVIGRGATVGANATIVCGTRIGRFAFIAAGAVVTRDFPDYALVMGNPAKQKGWMSRHGHPLVAPDTEGVMKCPESGMRYRLADGQMRCLDLPEDQNLPDSQKKGLKSYSEFK